jgi:hypothetical protein
MFSRLRLGHAHLAEGAGEQQRSPPKGTLVIAGGEGGKWTGVGRQLRALMLSLLVRQRLTMYISKHRQADLDALGQLTEAGQINPGPSTGPTRSAKHLRRSAAWPTATPEARSS